MKKHRKLPGLLLAVMLFTLAGCPAPQMPKPLSRADLLKKVSINLPSAINLHAKANAPDPTLVFVDITTSGTVCISGIPLGSDNTYDVILGKAVAEYGTTVPFCFQADQNTPFNAVWKRILAARQHRIFRFSFAAHEGTMMEFFVLDGPFGESVNTLGVDGDRWTYNGKEVTPRQLADIVHAGVHVLVQVNSETTHGQVVKAMDALWAAGPPTLVFADEKMN